MRIEQLLMQHPKCPVVKQSEYISWFIFPFFHGVAGRDCEGSQISQMGGEEIAMTPVVSLDYVFLSLSDNTSGEETVPILVLCDENTTYSLGLMVPRKGPEPHGVRDVCVFLPELGYIRMILKCNGGPSITALVTAVQKEWACDSKNFQRQLTPQVNPVDDHASCRAVEAMVHGLENLNRTIMVALEEVLGVSIFPTSRILPWLVGHQSRARNRFIVRASGRTLFEELTTTKFARPLFDFGEADLAKEWPSQCWLLWSNTLLVVYVAPAPVVTYAALAPVVEYAVQQSPTRRLLLRSCTSPPGVLDVRGTSLLTLLSGISCFFAVATFLIVSVYGDTWVLHFELVALCATLSFVFNNCCWPFQSCRREKKGWVTERVCCHNIRQTIQMV